MAGSGLGETGAADILFAHAAGPDAKGGNRYAEQAALRRITPEVARLGKKILSVIVLLIPGNSPGR
jgi:hypothetical protein